MYLLPPFWASNFILSTFQLICYEMNKTLKVFLIMRFFNRSQQVLILMTDNIYFLMDMKFILNF